MARAIWLLPVLEEKKLESHLGRAIAKTIKDVEFFKRKTHESSPFNWTSYSDEVIVCDWEQSVPLWLL
jgi:hypothetical protein